MNRKNDLRVLLDYAGKYKILMFIGLFFSAIAMILGMLPYVCIWMVAKDLIKVAPHWSQATSIYHYGWLAFIFAFSGIAIYFIALMCTHLVAFRTASNIRKKGIESLLKAPIGFFDTHASGLLRNRLDGGASQTETLLAHNLADIVGTIAMFITMIILMFIFDWRMGFACLLSALISILTMFYMMGGKNTKIIAEYQEAQDLISKAGTEYVRGIPVVKVFQQTVYSFKAFNKAIEDYSKKAEYFEGDVCRKPQSINLTFTESAFVFLVPVVLFLTPTHNQLGLFITNFIFYAIFSAIISTSLAKIMFASGGIMKASNALERINTVINAPILEVPDKTVVPKNNTVEFKDVSFSYPNSTHKALNHLSFTVKQGETIALVGPSGSGKTTAASLITRFWDVSSGSIEIGGVDIRNIDPSILMSKIAFVFQDNHLFKASIKDNVKISCPDASDEEVLLALKKARCEDIIEKCPQGINTIIGKGFYLSGGELQRIAIARAILKDAPIVLLDEATAFADAENEALIQKAMQELSQNKTVIMIAHRLSTVVDANKIIVLQEGKDVEQGRHEELINKNGLYAKLWSNYNKAVEWKI